MQSYTCGSPVALHSLPSNLQGAFGIDFIHQAEPFSSAIAPALLYLLHPCSRPLTPLTSAANMRSVHTAASTHCHFGGA
jgi:hypothetical protein